MGIRSVSSRSIHQNEGVVRSCAAKNPMSHRRKTKTVRTKYVFYFDESHKTDVIHISDDGKINIRSPRESDTSVGVFIGIPEDGIHEFEESFLKLENTTKRRIGMKPDGELKSTTFKKRHYEHGVASFNGAMVEFYTGLFELLLRRKVIIHMSFISKTEVLVWRLFRFIDAPDNVDVDMVSMMFGLIKYIDSCAGPGLTQALSKISSEEGFDEFRNALVEDYRDYVTYRHDESRSRGDKEIFDDLMSFLYSCRFDVSLEKAIPFPFFMMFDTLAMNLRERRMDTDIRLIIDGEQEQYPEAENFFEDVQFEDSVDKPMIRVCDHVAGFMGRLFKSMFDSRYAPVSGDERVSSSGRTLRLDAGWLELDESRFNLYKKVYLFLKRDQRFYTTTMSMLYCETPVMMYALFEYMGRFERFDNYEKVPLDFHQDMYECLSVNRLVARMERERLAAKLAEIVL